MTALRKDFHSPSPDEAALAARIRALEVEYLPLAARAVLERAIRSDFPRRIAVVSSFGAESAVLLDLVAAVDPATPVIFLDTGKLFWETRIYRDVLVTRLGLADVRSIEPNWYDLAKHDPDGALHATDPDRCCHIRKVLPLERALAGFDAWITGRKRFQGDAREALPVVEGEEGRIKVNPLARWTRLEVEARFVERDLPYHPLIAAGYPSIGCQPCTAAIGDGAGVRAGRWAGSGKTECGIHRAAWYGRDAG